MIKWILGYFIMGLIFLILRFVYHILKKKHSPENLIQAIKTDFVNICAYAKKLNSTKIGEDSPTSASGGGIAVTGTRKSCPSVSGVCCPSPML